MDFPHNLSLSIVVRTLSFYYYSTEYVTTESRVCGELFYFYFNSLVQIEKNWHELHSSKCAG